MIWSNLFISYHTVLLCSSILFRFLLVQLSTQCLVHITNPIQSVLRWPGEHTVMIEARTVLGDTMWTGSIWPEQRGTGPCYRVRILLVFQVIWQQIYAPWWSDITRHSPAWSALESTGWYFHLKGTGTDKESDADRTTRATTNSRDLVNLCFKHFLIHAQHFITFQCLLSWTTI